MGTIITMPLSGLLTKYGFDGGWASVFYCFGEYKELMGISRNDHQIYRFVSFIMSC